jgi:hypothetical protein
VHLPAPGDYATAEINQEQDMVSSVFAANYLFRYQTELLRRPNQAAAKHSHDR